MPFPQLELTDLERYAEEEFHAALTDVMSVFWSQGKIVLSQPLAVARSGKLAQLRVAARHFEVAPYRFLLNRPDGLRGAHASVCKSFNFKFADGVGFYSVKVDEGNLDPAQPWFLSDFIDATHDVTIANVRDEAFAFELDRSVFIDQTIDCRQSSARHARRGWAQIELPERIERGAFAFMRDVSHHFARLDFLRRGDGCTFLEADFNGEWGWLDPDATRGLMAKIVHEIDPTTPCFSCPRPAWSCLVQTSSLTITMSFDSQLATNRNSSEAQAQGSWRPRHVMVRRRAAHRIESDYAAWSPAGRAV